MRSGMKYFTACGILGLAMNVSAAADYPTGYDGVLSRPLTSPRTVHSLSRDSRSAEQPTITPSRSGQRKTLGALEEEFGGDVNEPAGPRTLAPQKSQPSSARGNGRVAASGLSGVKNYREELFGSSKPSSSAEATAQTGPRSPQRVPARSSDVTQASHADAGGEKSNLVHAEFQRAGAAKKAGEIRQVQATEQHDFAGPQVTSPQPEFDYNAPPADLGQSSPGSVDYDPVTEARPHQSAEPMPETRLRVLPAGPAASRTELPAPTRTEAPTHTESPAHTEVPAPTQPFAATGTIAASPARDTMASAAQAPSVTVAWVKQTEIRVGQECGVALVVKNTGESVASNLEIDAQFPNTVKLVSAQPQPTTAAERLSWSLASLQPGEEQKIQIRLIPSQRGDLETSASVRFTGAAAGVFRVEEPMLQIEVKGPEEVMAGDLASQTVVVSNPGTGMTTNVVVEAHVPEGLEHPRGERLILEIGTLAPGESRMVRLPMAAVKGGKQTVNIEARADANLAQSLARDINVIAPSLKVAVGGPSLRYIGRSAGYQVTVTNDGTSASNNVRVMHQLPQGFKFIRADKGGTFDAAQNSVGWFVGRLEAGESAVLQVELDGTEPGNFAHHVTATSDQGAWSAAEFLTQVEGTASLVLEIVDEHDPIEVGAETSYEVRISNEGTSAAKNVGVSCELPAAVGLIGAKGPVEHIVESGVIVFKALDHLDAGKTALYRITVTGKAPGNHRFRARLVSDSNEEPLIFEELTKFYGDPIPGSERSTVPPTAYRR